MTIVRTVTPAGEAIVILPEAEFDRLRDLAEDGGDTRIVEASLARLRAGEDELLTEADLDDLRAAPSPLAFWRARRSVSPEALARQAGLSAETVAALEAGRTTADTAVFERLAQALGVEAEDITP
ncbi:helix-turn-helix transcriptional regulator [Methylobacterium aerolatum]|uniref:Transcriptional regulator with XRE-family HTH domain n=1 Tax=Methylobacterium aerolatum TaxID=418708 RepID=A0ABU0I4J5_9HYPH|nr:helix-turn-helix transcriptional regulator [Methylobacterium aerolatum]MDQ0448948.1 transcriptional regulator with XRE-family HTH domain [Methylobacterium aerolatum]GJD34310.1 hypothetical protein FMGBMHLM_1208 [Methylobacterium aerolatum]